MTDRDFVLAPPTTTAKISIALEPAHNALISLMLLANPESQSGLSDWVMNTAAALPPDLAHRHRLVLETAWAALEPQQSWPSFTAYVDDLAALDAAILRDQVLNWVGKRELAGVEIPDRDTLLCDKAAFLGTVEAIFNCKQSEKGTGEDFAPYLALFDEAHDLLADPPALQALIVSHLRTMWSDWLAPEWTRVLPMLEESAAAFRQLDYSHMSALEAIRAVTGRDLSGFRDEWPSELIFVPSAHIGPYVSWFEREGATWLIFGARLPEGARVVSPALNRSELLVRLSALADDTRLRILELLTQHNELCAQDVIEKLELSQSAASRHLRQLTATGYLIERRREVAKCYSLNPRRVDDTLHALRRFLRK